MLGPRRRRWINIQQTLADRLVFTGMKTSEKITVTARKGLLNVVSVVGQRRRRWVGIKTTLF